MNTPIQDAVTAYQAKGWRPIRVRAGGKKAIGEGYQNSKPGPEEFHDGMNVAIMNGPTSEFLVDIDLDNVLARKIASLPDLFGTCPSFGREGLSPPGHYILYCRDIGDNAKRHTFKPEGDYIDVRAGKGYTVFPPSEHEAKIVWTRGEIPNEIPTWNWETLRHRAKLVAFLSTCLKFYTDKGMHDDYIMAVAGALAHGKIDPDVGERLIRGLCEFAGDEHEINQGRVPKVRAAINKLEAGEQVTGFTFLAETYFTEEFTKALNKYITPPAKHAKTDPNAIWVDDPHTNNYSDAVAARIMELDPHLMFRRGGNLVRLQEVDSLEMSRKDTVRTHPGTMEIIQVEESWLDYKVGELGMEFYGYTAKQKRKHMPPTNLKKRVINIGNDLPFLPLIGISTTPTLFCDKPGYDQESRLYMAFKEGLFPKGPAAPSKDESMAALKRLMNPWRLFPFAPDGSKSVAASAMISGVIRATMETCPLHAFNAHVAGAGKTLQAKMISLVVTGLQETNLVEYTSNEDEFAKRLFALYLRGPTNILIDNVNAQLKGSFFNIALTSSTTGGRILCTSEVPMVSTRALHLVTGNNLTANEEIQRRMVTSTITPDTEHPADRDFPFDPLVEIGAQRTQMVVDCLTILRGYITAGQPDKPTPLGSFEDWTIVRGALMWLEMEDPIKTQKTDMISDPDREARREILMALHKWSEGRTFTVAEISDLLDTSLVRQAFDGVLRNGWSSIAGGKRLGKYNGVWTGDLVLRKGRTEHNVVTWYIQNRDEKAAQLALEVPEIHEFGAAYARATG